MPPRVLAIVPVYNELGTVEDVLSQLSSLDGIVNEIVVVDDGSSDGSGQLIERWASDHPGVTVLRHETNRGYSQALLTGFGYCIRRLEEGLLCGADVVATLDADGQHGPRELPRLVEAMETRGLDVLWGRRDFSVYPRWKRLGNRVMTWIGRVFSGHPFADVESGYCLFRVDALATALQYRIRNWRYSLSMSLAVVLARLGFNLANDVVVRVPVYRSRTRVIDVVADTLAAADAWSAVTFSPLRCSPQARVKVAVGVLAAAFLAVTVALVAVKPVFLGYDSINSYVHVWSIAQSLRSDHSIPLRIPWLEGGQALAYPYAFLPWTAAALLYPLWGDYTVTWVLVAGFVLLLLSVFRGRLGSDPWLMTMFLVHPLLLQSLLSFQMAFIWASLFGHLFMTALERRARWWSLLWWVLAISTHPVVMGPLLAVYAAAVWVWRPERRQLVWKTAATSLPLLLPVAWYVSQAPAARYNSPLFLALTAASDVAIRGTLFFFPLLLLRAKRHASRRLLGPPSAAALACVSVVLAAAFGGFSSLMARADDPYQDFLQSSSFVPGATYRMLEPSDREQGHYYFVRQGAVLAQELFSESQVRRDWDADSYECFVAAKGIDYVVANKAYDRALRVNEVDLLDHLATHGVARRLWVDPRGRFEVFDVRPLRNAVPQPLRRCLGR